MVTSTKRRMPDRRTYVLDTSVLLADPKAMTRFDEHEVVLPIVVVTELEAKRHHPELGYFARQALRLLDDFRVRYGRLDAPIPIGDLGGIAPCRAQPLRPQRAPRGYRLGDNDSRILAVARNLQAEGYDVTVVSKDLPLRIKASSVGLLAEEYRAELAITDSGWTGMSELTLPGEQVDLLFDEESLLRPRGGRAARCTPVWSSSPSGARRSAGSRPRATSVSYAATGRRSASRAAAPSSASRSTCSSTRTSASCRWAAGPARASRRWRCARAWRPCWSGVSTRR